MRVQLRIVAGSLRGRKLNCTATPGLRPTPDMVRQALFSILGDAVPGRLFVDLFAGSGANGFEAFSRGASTVTFVERDFRLATDIERHLREFNAAGSATLVRADAYRWAERWTAPVEPVNVFISPPFADFDRRGNDLLLLVAELQNKLGLGSVVVVQGQHPFPARQLPDGDHWEERKYGRNVLLIWVKEARVASSDT
jgi:16S rRNA (guanine(966)-N(2))-methyltransferase RsmD